MGASRSGPDPRHHRRWLVCTVLFVVATVLALAVPMWLEEVSGLSPDHGNGEFELLLAVPFGVLSLVFGVLSVRTRKRVGSPT